MTAGQEVPNTVQTDPRRWVILAAVCAALTAIIVDNTILNVAVPTIEHDLGATPAELQAIINAYVVVFAGLLVAAGLVADRYGRRRAVTIGLTILTLASVAAAFAPSAGWLIAARTIMGVGAALVMPGTLAILVHTFAPYERVKAFAVWSAAGSAAMAIGPLLGGLMVERFGWPGVFVISAALSAAAVVLIAWLVPESRDPHHRTIDVPGSIAITVAIASIVSSIILAPDYGIAAPIVIAGLVLTIAASALFWVRQRRATSPMVEMSLYRNRQFAGASLAVAVLAIGTGSVLFVLTQHLQYVLNYTPLQAGLAIAPLAVGVVSASYVGARLPNRIGYRRSIVTGFAVTATGFLVLATLTPATPYAVIATGLLLAGIGSGLASPSVHTTVLGAVPPDRAGMGSALNDTHQQLGIALGVAIVGSAVATGYRHFAPASLNAEAGSSLGGTLSELSDNQDGLIHAAYLAFTQAQSIGMLTCAVFAVAGAVVAWCALTPDHHRPDRT